MHTGTANRSLAQHPVSGIGGPASTGPGRGRPAAADGFLRRGVLLNAPVEVLECAADNTSQLKTVYYYFSRA